MEKLTLAVTIDRPVGFNHHGTIYPVNYGYVAGVIGGDGGGAGCLHFNGR